jgi:hypothetical protein
MLGCSAQSSDCAAVETGRVPSLHPCNRLCILQGRSLASNPEKAGAFSEPGTCRDGARPVSTSNRVILL